MQIQVRLFAAARDLAGTDRIEVSLSDGADVAALRRGMVERVPSLADLLSRSLIAVDSQYAPDDLKIPTAADVAVIPPVSGG
ncbi:MAG: MoaD/ThiS family protein [Planctomycetia bacterium]|nr:MoaD/ThiS family protein [Planctomycetia bacterium]